MPDDFRFLSDFSLSGTRRIDLRTVEVSDKPISAVIVREGEAVKAPAVKKENVEDLLSRLSPVGRKATPRVLSQSIPPGTFVSRGTPVELVLVRSSDVTLGVLEDVHMGLIERSVEDLLPLFENPVVKGAIRKGDSSKVSDSEKQAIEQALSGVGVQIDEGDAQRTFDKAFKSLQGAQVFL